MLRSLMCFLVTLSVFSQKKIEVPMIPLELKTNATHIVVESKIDVSILSQSLYVVKNRRVVVVLNERGLENLDFKEYYSKSDKVKSIQVSAYNQDGMLQKAFKQRDFKNYSLSNGMSITDTRVLELEYKTNNFPAVFVFESELESKNTAFLPKWYPIDYYGKSIMKSSYSVTGIDGINIQSNLYNSTFFPINRKDISNRVEFTLENFPALVHETLAPPDLRLFLPYVISTSSKVNLEGINGVFENWKELGDWYYKEFIKGADVLAPSTQKKVQELVEGIEDPIEKARVLYAYMQSKTRYISIQLGIGGWRPMLAKDVDVLGYGDCKGLTNYYKALLKAAGIESYVVIVTASKTPINLERKSVCLQGNHMILAIPKEEGYQWVECTSQNTPFGHIAGFTDDRDVLVIKESGSELIRTKKYKSNENVQKSHTVYNLDENGDVVVNVSIASFGAQFNNRFPFYALDSREKDKAYRRVFKDFKNISFQNLIVEVDMKETVLKEEISFKSDKYATKLGNRLIFSLANWNDYANVLGNDRKRVIPVYLSMEWEDIDEVEVNIPEGFQLDFLPEVVEINSEFGYYKASLKVEGSVLFYKREVATKGRLIAEGKYDSYREFREKIASLDQVKVVLRKNN